MLVPQEDQILAYARETFEIEAEAVRQLSRQLTPHFAEAVRHIAACQGKVVVTGMGKSGIIGKKIAATLASTGTPSFFLHPGEAYHGDLGMISAGDVIVAISNSGETDEVLKIIPFLHDNGNAIVALTGKPESTLARHAQFHLHVGVRQEACPLALAPTSSTTATLAMGDALAVALMKVRQFQSEDFARFHPGGSLGRRLLTRVRDVMVGPPLPCASPEANIKDTLQQITRGGLGLAAVIDAQGRLAGLVTDGDIRRAMEAKEEQFFSLRACDIMSARPVTISPEAKVTEAEALMNERHILALLVTDAQGALMGVLPYKKVFFGPQPPAL